jgi:hypothetical protein
MGQVTQAGRFTGEQGVFTLGFCYYTRYKLEK